MSHSAVARRTARPGSRSAAIARRTFRPYIFANYPIPVARQELESESEILTTMGRRQELTAKLAKEPRAWSAARRRPHPRLSGNVQRGERFACVAAFAVDRSSSWRQFLRPESHRVQARDVRVPRESNAGTR